MRNLKAVTYEDVSISGNIKADDDTYSRKYELLNDFFLHTFRQNNRLRHRIYHVKKEINHLKRLKRALCERLIKHNDFLVDLNLEIPDKESNISSIMYNENGSCSSSANFSGPFLDSTLITPRTLVDALTTDGVVTLPSGSILTNSPLSIPRQRRRRRAAPTAGRTAGSSFHKEKTSNFFTSRTTITADEEDSDVAQRNIIAIIDSVVKEAHGATTASQQEKLAKLNENN